MQTNGPDYTKRDLRRAEERIAELEALVFVPGHWQCAKCKFQLVQATLHATNGAVTSRDTPGDKCPNCHSPLWRVTERDAGNDMVDRCTRYAEENLRLRQALGAHIQADAYRDDVPDNDQDAAHLRKQETWWRLTARGWLTEDDTRSCAADAKVRATDERTIPTNPFN